VHQVGFYLHNKTTNNANPFQYIHLTLFNDTVTAVKIA